MVDRDNGPHNNMINQCSRVISLANSKRLQLPDCNLLGGRHRRISASLGADWDGAAGVRHEFPAAGLGSRSFLQSGELDADRLDRGK